MASGSATSHDNFDEEVKTNNKLFDKHLLSGKTKEELLELLLMKLDTEEKEESIIDEPLLDKKNERFAIFPIQHHDIWAMYKKHEAAIWHAHEVKLDKDKPHWNKLTPDEKHFISMVLAFFASSDMIVAQNLGERFLEEVTIPEAKFFYGFQLMMENIHSEVYSKLIDGYIKNKVEKTKLFNAVITIPCVASKAKWAMDWISSKSSFASRMVGFAVVEGIFFSGSFCAIYWMNERGILPGLAKANDFIARDEGMHTEFACLLYTKYVKHKMTQDKFEKLIKEAVELEINFITVAIPCRLLGMNSNNMIKYIKFCANRLSQQLGHANVYSDKEAVQPFSFMDRICLREKSNFFEDDPSGYRKFDNTAEDSSGDEYGFD